MTQPEALTPTDKALACLKYILAILDGDEDPSESLRNEASAQLKLALQAQGALQAAPEPLTAYMVDDEIFRSRSSANAWAHENDSHVREGVFIERGAAPQAAVVATPEPVARVKSHSFVNQGPVTYLEWLGAPPPEGTLLYAASIGVPSDSQTTQEKS